MIDRNLLGQWYLNPRLLLLKLHRGGEVKIVSLVRKYNLNGQMVCPILATGRD